MESRQNCSINRNYIDGRCSSFSCDVETFFLASSRSSCRRLVMNSPSDTMHLTTGRAEENPASLASGTRVLPAHSIPAQAVCDAVSEEPVWRGHSCPRANPTRQLKVCEIPGRNGARNPSFRKLRTGRRCYAKRRSYARETRVSSAEYSSTTFCSSTHENGCGGVLVATNVRIRNSSKLGRARCSRRAMASRAS